MSIDNHNSFLFLLGSANLLDDFPYLLHGNVIDLHNFLDIFTVVAFYTLIQQCPTFNLWLHVSLGFIRECLEISFFCKFGTYGCDFLLLLPTTNTLWSPHIISNNFAFANINIFFELGDPSLL